MNDDPARRAAWAAYLRERMEARGLTVRALGAACGVSGAAVQKWRNGARPTLELARALAAMLGVDVYELVRAAEGEPVKPSLNGRRKLAGPREVQTRVRAVV
jgi:transcriptional regulator with XRE-family HTH domain